jgi:hypothetical protein
LAGSSAGIGLAGTGIVSSITGSQIQYAFGGNAGLYNAQTIAVSGLAGSGNGGAGSNNGNATGQVAGNGGSGIVVLRYPSYLKQAASTTGSPTTYIAGPYRVYVFYASGTITF